MSTTWKRNAPTPPQDCNIKKRGSESLRNLKRLFQYKYTLVTFVALVGAHGFGLFSALSESLAKPLEFGVREKMKQDPDLSEEIAIISLDDVSTKKLGRTELTNQEWYDLLKYISRHQPREILIDKVFQNVSRDRGLEQLLRDRDRFVSISSGAYASPQKVQGSNELASGKRLKPDIQVNINSHDETRIIIGPSEKIAPFFSSYGLLNYIENGLFPAYLRSRQGGYFTSLGLHAARKIELIGERLIADENPVPIRPDGNIRVNLSAVGKYYERSFSVSSILEQAKANRPVQKIKRGGVVFILPMMYTGNADFKQTPLGDLPGGLLHVSIANSVLSGQWLTSLDFPQIALICAGTIAFFLAHLLSPVAAAASLASLSLLITVLGIGSFVYSGLFLPWSESIVTCTLIGLTAIAEKARTIEKRSLQIRHTLAGLVGPKHLQAILSSPDRIMASARQENLTVMFIDIEEFSIKCQQMEADLVFRRLRQELNHLCKIVHLYGGIVDKTLGDGLMCYFGQTFTDGYTLTSREHALAALGCAIDIQIDSAKRAIAHSLSNSDSDGKKLDFPLRIGIDTGPVFAGNIGSDGRIDLTVIGKTVNWAKRYEDASESFRIMLGPNTVEAISNSPLQDECAVRVGDLTYHLRRRDLVVKHYDEKWSGWECNPFEHDPQMLTDALLAADAAANTTDPNRKRVSSRNGTLLVVFEGGEVGRVVEFSDTLLIATSNSYLSRGDTVSFRLYIEDSGTRRPLEHCPDLSGAVAWGVQICAQEHEYSRHAIRFHEPDASARRALMDRLAVYAEE